jgi:hypothetical protein
MRAELVAVESQVAAIGEHIAAAEHALEEERTTWVRNGSTPRRSGRSS